MASAGINPKNPQGDYLLRPTYDLRNTTYDFTKYDLRLTKYDLRLTTYGLRNRKKKLTKSEMREGVVPKSEQSDVHVP